MINVFTDVESIINKKCNKFHIYQFEIIMFSTPRNTSTFWKKSFVASFFSKKL